MKKFNLTAVNELPLCENMQEVEIHKKTKKQFVIRVKYRPNLMLATLDCVTELASKTKSYCYGYCDDVDNNCMYFLFNPYVKVKPRVFSSYKRV